MFTKGSLEQSRTSTMELFFSSVKPYFKSVLNSIKLPLGSIFCTTRAKEKHCLFPSEPPGDIFFPTMRPVNFFSKQVNLKNIKQKKKEK